jgi:hypothetical protein
MYPAAFSIRILRNYLSQYGMKSNRRCAVEDNSVSSSFRIRSIIAADGKRLRMSTCSAEVRKAVCKDVMIGICEDLKCSDSLRI